jgi:hypothetical protein
LVPKENKEVGYGRDDTVHDRGRGHPRRRGCGKLSGVVFDPAAQAVTHLVVEPHGLEQRVPLDLADASPASLRPACSAV